MTARKPVSGEPLISMAEVADRLGVPLETLRRWRKHHRGPLGYPLGKRVQFRWSEVEAWLQQQKEQPHLSVVPTTVPTAVGGRPGRTTHRKSHQ